MASNSMLETVAQHESALMEDLKRARTEARRVVESAHSAGAALLQESNAKLDEDVAGLRRNAATAREAERVQIQQDTEVKVAQIRAKSTGNSPVVCDELIARVLPSIA